MILWGQQSLQGHVLWTQEDKDVSCGPLCPAAEGDGNPSSSVSVPLLSFPVRMNLVPLVTDCCRFLNVTHIFLMDIFFRGVGRLLSTGGDGLKVLVIHRWKTFLGPA